MVIQTKTYTALVSTTSTSISDEIVAKKRQFLSKTVILEVETTFCHTFLSSELQCLPCGDPRNLAQTQGFNYWIKDIDGRRLFNVKFEIQCQMMKCQIKFSFYYLRTEPDLLL